MACKQENRSLSGLFIVPLRKRASFQPLLKGMLRSSTVSAPSLFPGYDILSCSTYVVSVDSPGLSAGAFLPLSLSSAICNLSTAASTGVAFVYNAKVAGLGASLLWVQVPLTPSLVLRM